MKISIKNYIIDTSKVMYVKIIKNDKDMDVPDILVKEFDINPDYITKLSDNTPHSIIITFDNSAELLINGVNEEEIHLAFNTKKLLLEKDSNKNTEKKIFLI